MNRLTYFFWLCSGANIKVLKDCPTESSKYVGIGATIFFTGLFAAIAGGYALYTVFDSVWIAMLFGVVWGLMIFNLDRYIVSGMRKEGKPWNQWLMALPRLVLALIISVVIAKPLELKIFEKEINEELTVMQQEQLKKNETLILERFTPERDRINARIKTLKAEISMKEMQRDTLRKIARQEADGTGGTMKRNAGPIYAIKKADADRADKELEELRKKNNALLGEAGTQLQKTDSLVALAQATVNNDKANGPAARIQALGRLTDRSEEIYWANVFVMLLFIAVETAPIFVKLISQRGPYDHRIKEEEYPYETSRIEVVTRTTSAAREQVRDLNQADQSFANTRLDTALKSS